MRLRLINSPKRSATTAVNSVRRVAAPLFASAEVGAAVGEMLVTTGVEAVTVDPTRPEIAVPTAVVAVVAVRAEVRAEAVRLAVLLVMV